MAAKRRMSIMGGILIGLILATVTDLGFFQLLQIGCAALFGYAGNGLIIGAGAGPMHSIVGGLQGIKDSLSNLGGVILPNNKRNNKCKPRSINWTANPLIVSGDSSAFELPLRFFNEGQHIFQGHITFDAMRRREDVTALPSEFDQVAGFGAHIFHRAIRQRLLGGKSAVESQPSTVLLQ